MAKYKVGDRVKIINKWRGDMGQNMDGAMDEFLGTTMTISEIREDGYEMLEDNGHWYWYEDMVEDLASDTIYEDTKTTSHLTKRKDGTYIIEW